jgi:hypothetical protein
MYKLIADILVTGDKFIAGVTGDNCSPVSLSLVRNLSPVSVTPAITENPWQGLFAGVVDTGNKFIADLVGTGEQLIAGVVDAGDKHSFAIISANFLKKFETSPTAWGPGGQ